MWSTTVMKEGITSLDTTPVVILIYSYSFTSLKGVFAKNERGYMLIPN